MEQRYRRSGLKSGERKERQDDASTSSDESHATTVVLNQAKCQSSSPFSPFLEKRSLPLLLILYFDSLWPSPCSLT